MAAPPVFDPLIIWLPGLRPTTPSTWMPFLAWIASTVAASVALSARHRVARYSCSTETPLGVTVMPGALSEVRVPMVLPAETNGTVIPCSGLKLGNSEPINVSPPGLNRGDTERSRLKASSRPGAVVPLP